MTDDGANLLEIAGSFPLVVCLRCTVAPKMRVETEMFHVSSLLSKYAEYSEAELTRQMSQLLSSKANLTEALGVSAELGGMMQATYEELKHLKPMRVPSRFFDVFRKLWMNP